MDGDMRRAAWAAVGGVVALSAWVVLVPWDLSEVDAAGRVREGGGDDSAVLIVAVGALVVVVTVALVRHQRTRRVAASFATGGLWAWAALFAQRAGTAETSGANLFMGPLLGVVGVAVTVPMVVRATTSRGGTAT